jgi:hypothetical protein
MSGPDGPSECPACHDTTVCGDDWHGLVPRSRVKAELERLAVEIMQWLRTEDRELVNRIVEARLAAVEKEEG